jgi:hypothetical protein
MNKIVVLIFSIVLYLIFIPSLSHATGIGVFGSVTGDQHLKLFTGAGLVIDTNCSADKLFNYRLAIGGYKFVLSRDESIADPANLDLMMKFSLLNTFGFGLVRKESFRFWLGPQIGVHTRYFRSNEKLSDKLIWSIAGTGPPVYYQNGPDSMVGASAGLSFGFNFNFIRNITMSIEFGGNYYLFHGITNGKTIIANISSMIMANNSMTKDNFMEINASIAILYRIKDSYATGISEMK